MKRNCVLMVSLLCCLFLSSCGGQNGHLKLPDEETIKASQKMYGVAKLTSASLTKDENGDPAILVEYTWTNTTDHPLDPYLSVLLMATQADTEDDSICHWLGGGHRTFNKDSEEVLPGTTVNAEDLFTLHDETGIVTVGLYGGSIQSMILGADVLPEDDLVDTADYDPASLPNSQ